MARKVIDTPSGPVVIYSPDEEVVPEAPVIQNVNTTRRIDNRDIDPSGYFTTDSSIGGGSGAMKNLLDPNDPAGAYRAFLESKLYPSDVGDYSNITSKGALASGPFNLVPTGEGMLTTAMGAVNPLFGLMTQGALNARNADALETLVKSGILTAEKTADSSQGIRKLMGYNYVPKTGEYRLSPETQSGLDAYVSENKGSTPKDYFESQFQSKYGQANELARYLDQVAYTTQGDFFTKDFFGNPTPWSKYIDRQGNIKSDALDTWDQFGQQDKMGVLANMSNDADQGTPEVMASTSSSSGGQSSGGGGIDKVVMKRPDFKKDPKRGGYTRKYTGK
jgi:hypothetical protein